MFDPKSSGDGDGGGDRGPLETGDYILAMTWFERRFGKQSGNAYLQCCYKVVMGPAKGRTFFSSLGIDTDNSNIAGRLGVYCKCIGRDEPFDLEDDGEIKKVFVGKPFKGKVSKRTRGQYTDNDISRYITTVTDEESAAMRMFAKDWEDGTSSPGGWGQSGGGMHPDDPGPGGNADPFAGGASGGGGGSDPFDRDPPPHDDDIPF